MPVGLMDAIDKANASADRPAAEEDAVLVAEAKTGESRTFELLVERQSPGQTAGPPGLAESLVLSSGRPIIVFPPRGKVSRVRRILVAWNATRESIRAVADAMPLLVKAEAGEVFVVHHQRHPQGHCQEPGADIPPPLARPGA